MKPRGPNENTKAIEVVKGGEISGKCRDVEQPTCAAEPAFAPP